MVKILFFDTEYYNTNAEKYKVVCSVTYDSLEDSHRVWWVHEDPLEFVEYIKSKNNEGYILCSHNVSAEVSALYSLNINVSDYKFICTMAEVIQLQNQNHNRQYGKYYFNGKCGISTFGNVKDKGDHTHVGYGLSASIYNILEVTPNPNKKNTVRRILQGGPFNERDKQDILEYCESDIEYLPLLLKRIAGEIRKLGNVKGIPITAQEYISYALERGEWMKNCALIERRGIPINMERLTKIQDNSEEILNSLKKNLSENIYPFYRLEKNKWVKCDTSFNKFVISKGLSKVWPQTATSTEGKVRFSSSDDALQQFKTIKEIHEFMRVISKSTSLKHVMKRQGGFKEVFNEKTKKEKKNADGSMTQKIGEDGRLRVCVFPYGSLTSRNQPSGAQFIFLMSSWMRSLIQPPEGKVIIGGDFKAQETLIAARESGDTNLELAYDSGDSYVYFAKLAGAIPPNGTKHTHPFERKIYKQVTLATQYCMGAVSMAATLTKETGKAFTQGEAGKLIQQHRKIFYKYWEWHAKTIRSYEDRVPIKLRDGWYIWTDNPNPRSVGNCPIQGNGQVILREAVKRCHAAGLYVCASLHDAVYIECDEKNKNEQEALLRKCMNDAFVMHYGRDVGVDTHVHKREEEWIEEKAEDDVWNLREYIFTPEELQRYESQQKWDKYPDRLTEYLSR